MSLPKSFDSRIADMQRHLQAAGQLARMGAADRSKGEAQWLYLTSRLAALKVEVDSALHVLTNGEGKAKE